MAHAMKDGHLCREALVLKVSIPSDRLHVSCKHTSQYVPCETANPWMLTCAERQYSNRWRRPVLQRLGLAASPAHSAVLLALVSLVAARLVAGLVGLVSFLGPLRSTAR